MSTSQKTHQNRTGQTIMTPASRILKYMRVTKRISMREAGRLCNLSDSTINHYEKGRIDIPDRRLKQLVKTYGYTMEDYESLADGRALPVLNLKTECIGLLELIDEKKLKTVHAVLTSLIT